MIDPRIVEGLRDQLAVRAQRLRGGERPLGWKVGFGAPAAIERFGTDRPLVGFLLETSLLADGSEVPVGGWAAPAFEAEIAVRLGADLAPGALWDEVHRSITGTAAAIELADVDPPPDDVREILRGNIFHRHVLLGPFDDTRRDGTGIAGRVVRDGEEVAANDDPAALTGEIVEVVRLCAETLGAVGECLRAGEVIITGSVVPPVPVSPGQHLVAELGPLGRLGVRLTV